MSKNFVFKKLIDALTVVLLAAAFGMSYYFGMVSKISSGDPQLPIAFLAAISIGGLGMLFAVGSGSVFYTRAKRCLLTKPFTIAFAAQVASLLGMTALMIALLMEMFPEGVDSPVVRVLYLIFTLVIIAGYTESVFVSEPIIKMDEDAEDEDFDDDDAEDSDDGDGEDGDDDEDAVMPEANTDATLSDN